MNMCIKMDMLTKGMVSEKEMYELALKHNRLKITEQEFREFWETIVMGNKNIFEGYADFSNLQSWSFPTSKSVSTMNQLNRYCPEGMKPSSRRGRRRQRSHSMRIKSADLNPYTSSHTANRPPSRRSSFRSPRGGYIPPFAPGRRYSQRNPVLLNQPLRGECL